MTIQLLSIYSFACMSVGLALATAGWCFALFKKQITGCSSAKYSDSRAALWLILLGGFALGLSVIGFFVSGGWWLFLKTLPQLTPLKLAGVSLVVCSIPLIFSAIAMLLARLCGGRVDASGARNCRLMGIDFGPLVYTLFMVNTLCAFFLGLGFIGLAGSLYWAWLY